jgi:hypothetical protein
MKTTIRTSYHISTIALTCFLCQSTPLTAWSDEYMELPNRAKLDVSSTCPVCGMKVGGELAGGVAYAYREGQLFGFAGTLLASGNSPQSVPRWQEERLLG